MPCYQYRCTKCEQKTDEVFQGINDPPLTLCLHCNTDTLVRVIFPVFGFVRGSSNQTLGSLAEQNTKRLSDSQKAKIMEREKLPERPLPRGMTKAEKPTEKESPFSDAGSATPRQIKKMSKDKKLDYIMTGKV